MLDINRYPGNRRGRCGGVSFNGLVYAVATDTSAANGVAEQTRRALAELERTLEKAGSGKSALLQATVYLNDIGDKAEMDEVWCEWVGDEENWPQRACIGVDLANADLIEIVVVAVELQSKSAG